MANANILQLNAATTWRGGVASSSQIRQFAPVMMDEPQVLGGQDQGANPLEYILAALNGCHAVMIPLIAKEIDFKFTGLSFDCDAEVDLRGLMGQSGISPHFQKIAFSIVLDTDETDARFEALQQRVAARCPVYRLLKDAGVAIAVQWQRVAEASPA
ncbi:OsmC family protein [Acinetobacter larvae]|uniref:Osmotically inducible protein C n=1 Tax=Acinetobacter larvae TaxID=1789224 RepID=A0A1B2M2C8_9GAMM|nr:OsmC family protein [Acinetobacter larvae]AOA59342.1 osmotically inducible protein C [Acinetobacter larvae]